MIKFINLENGNTFDGSWKTVIDPDTKDVREVGYIHKFEGQQSIDIYYNKVIGFICDKLTVNITLDDPIFCLYKSDKIDTSVWDKDVIQGVEYTNINNHLTDNITSTGVAYENYFIHHFNVIAKSSIAGTNLAKFFIDDNLFVVGADFYDENESLKINLGNFGLDIPETILKAIYTSNIKEDYADYILLNRKMKELLTNYWDLIANKGSYNSLLKSLQWFEYGNLVNLSNVWVHETFGKTIYEHHDLSTVMSDTYEQYLLSKQKTTYMALTMALHTIYNKAGQVEYDDEHNPILHNILDVNELSKMWTIEELILKMSLLGTFFETYFMPVHLDLIHSTVEHVVFTNTVKLINHLDNSREDSYNNFRPVRCKVNDGDLFYLNDVSVLVGWNTKMAHHMKSRVNYNKARKIPLYYKNGLVTPESDNNILLQDSNKILIRYGYDGVQNQGLYYNINEVPNLDFESYDNIAYMVGVDLLIQKGTPYEKEPLTDPDKGHDDVRTFFSQNYTGPGVMVDLTCYVHLDKDDYIKQEVISYIPDDDVNEHWYTMTSYDIFADRTLKSTGGYTDIVKIPFNILCREAREYDIHLQFISAEGRTFVKNIKFKVVDPVGNRLTLYRICHKDLPSNGFNEFEFNCLNDYTFGRQAHIPYTGTDEDIYLQHRKWNLFIPTYDHTKDADSKYEGVCLNHVMIIKTNGSTDISDTLKQELQTLYFIDEREIYDETKPDFTVKYKTYICVSRKFWFKLDKHLKDNIKAGLNGSSISRNDYGYFPEFHKLVPFGLPDLSDPDVRNSRTLKFNINDNIITDWDTLCVIPDFSYGTNIGLDTYEWIFKNVSTGKEIKVNASVKEPFIGNDEKTVLPAGYYNIIFKYSLTNDGTIHTMEWDSAFIKK